MKHTSKLLRLLIFALISIPTGTVARPSNTTAAGSDPCCPSLNQKATQPPSRKTMKTNLEENPTPAVSISCRLTSPALQERKRTVLASLQKLVLEQKELPNGYAYRFKGTDATLDELITFVKTERQCCPFFDFGLLIQPDENVWLELTGPEGAKDFIDAEIELTSVRPVKNE